MGVRPLEQPEVNPPFNMARRFATVTAPPPFSFSGVTMRFFPLKADFATLARFVDSYLNIAPHFAYFRPSMPFVMLGIINYGKMTMEAGNMGWTSQNELVFSIPLEWYAPGDGEWVFQDHAQVAPFIYVDNESSQIGGREVYGWPKLQGWFAPELNGWETHPRAQRKVLELETRAFTKLYQGERLEPHTLLTIEEEPPLTYSVFPPLPDNPLNPMVSLSRSVVQWTELLQKMASMAMALPMQGYAPIDRQTLPRAMESQLSVLTDYAQNFVANTVNLKQFRDSACPNEYCYQAITNAKMEITQFRRGGMLGDLPLLRGDPGAGFDIFLRRYPTVPIVDTLGLDVAAEYRDGSVDVAKIRPVMPFWLEVDLTYLAGENLCWRTNEQSWRDERIELSSDDADQTDMERAGERLYNTTGAEGLQVATGPYSFPNATLRVLPMLADQAKLQAFCDAYLNEPGLGYTGHRFEVYGRYVYLVVKAFDEMSSETNNMGLWAETEANFIFPVKWYKRDQFGETLAGAGYIAPFMFTSSAVAATAGREVAGWTTIEAAIERPPNPWLGSQGPYADDTPLMRLSTDVFPALGVGQRSEWRRLIEIADGQTIAWDDRRSWARVAEQWGAEVKQDVERMAERASQAPEDFERLRTLALELLGNRAAINQFSLKQFRDAEEPESACYQSIVRSSIRIERIHDLREIEDRTHVKIYRYPTQPIVEMLGLVVHSRLDDSGTQVDVIKPCRPFYIKADVASQLGEKICWRAGSLDWRGSEAHPTVMAYEAPSGAWDESTMPRLEVGPGLRCRGRPMAPEHRAVPAELGEPESRRWHDPRGGAKGGRGRPRAADGPSHGPQSRVGALGQPALLPR